MLAIISILLTNLESLNKTEMKQTAVCIVNKNKKKRKKSFPSGTVNSFQIINEEILTGSQKQPHLSDLSLALKGHRTETQLLKFLQVSNSCFILGKRCP